MVPSQLKQLLQFVKEKKPMHYKKLATNPHLENADYLDWAESFLSRYETFRNSRGLSLETACEYYLQVVADTLFEQIQFFRDGEYSCKSFADAYENVYSKPDVMEYYMNGLLLTQVLWHHHYEVFRYFTKTVASRVGTAKRYLEIGGGHGAYVAEAVRLLGNTCYFEVVDISPTSLEMARELVATPGVEFKLQDVYEYEGGEGFDLIVLGEVLEHVETPVELLKAIGKLTRPGGELFLTTPINAPAIDHISLFRSPDHLRSIFQEGGWEVADELVLPSEALPLEQVLERKLPIMYAGMLSQAG